MIFKKAAPAKLFALAKLFAAAKLFALVTSNAFFLMSSSYFLVSLVQPEIYFIIIYLD